MGVDFKRFIPRIRGNSLKDMEFDSFFHLINSDDPLYFRYFLVACKQGDFSTVKYLVEYLDVDPMWYDDLPMQLALRSGNSVLCSYLRWCGVGR
jgi:hypothetical protein